MKEIINVFLDRIVIDVINNVSTMNKTIDSINQYEQMAHDSNR